VFSRTNYINKYQAQQSPSWNEFFAPNVHPAPKPTRAGAIDLSEQMRFIPAKPENPQAALCSGQKATASERVGFGAAALRASIPRPHSNP
jgi:hypothetical protein